jgi:hypothetical protein
MSIEHTQSITDIPINFLNYFVHNCAHSRCNEISSVDSTRTQTALGQTALGHRQHSDTDSTRTQTGLGQTGLGHRQHSDTDPSNVFPVIMVVLFLPPRIKTVHRYRVSLSSCHMAAFVMSGEVLS